MDINICRNIGEMYLEYILHTYYICIVHTFRRKVVYFTYIICIRSYKYKWHIHLNIYVLLYFAYVFNKKNYISLHGPCTSDAYALNQGGHMSRKSGKCEGNVRKKVCALYRFYILCDSEFARAGKHRI